MGKLKIYIFLFALLIGVLILIEAGKPKPVDWSPSFNRNHKQPWGTYILFHELKNLFKDSDIKVVKKTPYEFLKYKYFNDENKASNAYIFINDYFNMDEESVNELLRFVDKGNAVFISAGDFSRYLKDTLHFKTDYRYIYSYKDTLKKKMYFTNEKLQQDNFLFLKGFKSLFIDSLDVKTSTILGKQKVKEKESVNYAKIEFGKGIFYIHTQPFAFTNYHILKDNHHQYISNALSYLDAKTYFWDAKMKTGTDISRSSLRFILSHPPLKWAWRLAWLGVIIFVIFRAKRRQRVVPIIEKLPNTSVAFAKTIGNMYFNEGEPNDIIQKKITFFLEDIRKRYLLDTQNLDDAFKKRLYNKTGVPKEEIDRLINYILTLQKVEHPKEHQLVTLNKLLEKFYKKTSI